MLRMRGPPPLDLSRAVVLVKTRCGPKGDEEENDDDQDDNGDHNATTSTTLTSERNTTTTAAAAAATETRVLAELCSEVCGFFSQLREFCTGIFELCFSSGRAPHEALQVLLGAERVLRWVLLVLLGAVCEFCSGPGGPSSGRALLWIFLVLLGAVLVLPSVLRVLLPVFCEFCKQLCEFC